MKHSGPFLTLAIAAILTAGCDSTPSTTPAPEGQPTASTPTPPAGKGARKKKPPPDMKNARVPKLRKDL